MRSFVAAISRRRRTRRTSTLPATISICLTPSVGWTLGLRKNDADEAAKDAKDAVEGMTVSATPLTASDSPTVIKTVDPETGIANIGFGMVPGTTFSPSVSGDGVLSWSNDGNKTNPQSVDIAGAVRGVFDEVVTGTDPVIVGVGNHRYLCGEVATISITPPATGIIDVFFASGTTPTVLTLPATVLMPEWFDVTALDPERIYEIGIEEGVYGGVRSWAL